jgi:Zn-dependent peptidase ImmA (M78 family)
LIYTSGTNQKQELAHKVFDWFNRQIDFDAVIEVYHTDLSEDGVYGWSEMDSNKEYIISIHDQLSDEDYTITLLHELIHVVQTIRGLVDDNKRENQAYMLEGILTKSFQQSS